LALSQAKGGLTVSRISQKHTAKKSFEPGAIREAYKRRNRIPKLVRTVIANILAMPAHALFSKIGLDWASWLVMIVVMVYSMIILVSPGTSASWQAHLEKWKGATEIAYLMGGLPRPVR
jgi:hypothetical protein